MNMKDNMETELLKIAKVAVKHSESHLRLVHSEDNKTDKPVPEVAHFLKFNDERLGRDIDLYGFLGKISGWSSMLVQVSDPNLFISFPSHLQITINF